MIVRSHKVTPETVARIVEHVGRQYGDNLAVGQSGRAIYRDGTGWTGRVVPRASSGRGARRSWQGRRLRATCWHAYRDVMLAIYDVDPAAVILTAMARYNGREGFLDTYPSTADRNVGSMVQPAYMPELCECEGDLASEYGDPADDGARVPYNVENLPY